MNFTAKVRLHFNRHGAAPLVWCIATDDFEIAVRGIAVEVPVATVYVLNKTVADDEDGKPSAWIETAGEARITIAHGYALLQEPA